jgi:hypothetical protein
MDMASQPYTGPSYGSDPAVRETRRTEEKELVSDASSGKLTDERRDRVRQASLGEIPWWYNPWGHLASTTGVALVTLAVSAWQLHAATASMKWTDFLTIPIVFLLANFFEWRVHKHVLHRRRWPMQVIYDKHTPMHHMIYVEDDMAMRTRQEFRLVLMPAMGVLGVVIATTPFALAVAYLWSPAAGYLFLVASSVYMVAYELLHLSYHLPKDSFIGRRPLIAKLRAHHAKHHDPRFMQRWNFNVNIPLFDWILGTMIAKDGDTHAKRRPFRVSR